MTKMGRLMPAKIERNSFRELGGPAYPRRGLWVYLVTFVNQSTTA